MLWTLRTGLALSDVHQLSRVQATEPGGPLAGSSQSLNETHSGSGDRRGRRHRGRERSSENVLSVSTATINSTGPPSGSGVGNAGVFLLLMCTIAGTSATAKITTRILPP